MGILEREGGVMGQYCTLANTWALPWWTGSDPITQSDHHYPSQARPVSDQGQLCDDTHVTSAVCLVIISHAGRVQLYKCSQVQEIYEASL